MNISKDTIECLVGIIDGVKDEMSPIYKTDTDLEQFFSRTLGYTSGHPSSSSRRNFIEAKIKEYNGTEVIGEIIRNATNFAQFTYCGSTDSELHSKSVGILGENLKKDGLLLIELGAYSNGNGRIFDVRPIDKTPVEKV